jgi:hypothetical protein
VASGFPVSPTDYSTHTFTNSGSISGVTITTGDLYQYNGSAWIFQINTVGADGANSSSVLYNDCSDDSSGAAGAQTLKTYTTPTTITTDGSYLDIETLWQVNAGVDGTLTIEYATDIPNIIDVPVSTTSTTYIRVFARVHRTSGTTTFVETWYETLGTPNSKVEFAPITTGDDVGAANVIAAVRNLTVGAPADVICKKLTVTVFNL